MSTETITVDGSKGSGSGTLVRDVAGLAVLTGARARLVNIRSRRDRPGLCPQQLKALQACAQISGGELWGGETGSREVLLEPGGSQKVVDCAELDQLRERGLITRELRERALNEAARARGVRWGG